MRQMLIHQNFQKVPLAYLKSEANKLDIDKVEKIPTGLSTFKSKVDKLDIKQFSKKMKLLKRLTIMN